MNRQEEIIHQNIAVTWHNKYCKQPLIFQRLICYWNNSESAKGGNKMRSMGVKSGVSDWLFLHNNGVMWLELKTETGSQSQDQIKFQALCESLGHEYKIIRSEAEMWAAITPLI